MGGIIKRNPNKLLEASKSKNTKEAPIVRPKGKSNNLEFVQSTSFTEFLKQETDVSNSLEKTPLTKPNAKKLRRQHLEPISQSVSQIEIEKSEPIKDGFVRKKLSFLTNREAVERRLLEELRKNLSGGIKNLERSLNLGKQKRNVVEEKSREKNILKKSQAKLDPLKIDVNEYFIPKKVTLAQEYSEFHSFMKKSLTKDKINVENNDLSPTFTVNPNKTSVSRRTNIYDRINKNNAKLTINTGANGYLNLKTEISPKKITGVRKPVSESSLNEIMELQPITKNEVIEGGKYFNRHKNIDRSEFLRKYYKKKKIMIVDEKEDKKSQSVQHNMPTLHKQLDETLHYSPRKFSPSPMRKPALHRENAFNFDEKDLKELQSPEKKAQTQLFTSPRKQINNEPKKPFITLYDKMALSILKQKLDNEDEVGRLSNNFLPGLRTSSFKMFSNIPGDKLGTRKI